MFSLRPGIKKEKFSVEEDCILMAAIKEYGTNFNMFPQNLLAGRTTVQIRNRYNNVLRYVGQARHWSAEDDIRLMQLVQKYGASDWVNVANELKSHTRFSCRSRHQTIIKYLKKNPDKTVQDVPRKKKLFSTDVTQDNWMETIIKIKQIENKVINDSTKEQESNNDYFDYFKYSYNFSMEPPTRAKYELDAAQLACPILNSRLCPVDTKILYEGSKQSITNLEQLNYPQQKTNDAAEILMCPNQCTAMLFRGLSIMFPERRKTTIPINTNHVQLDLFQKRFNNLLHSTVQMSKLDFPTDKQPIKSYDKKSILFENVDVVKADQSKSPLYKLVDEYQITPATTPVDQFDADNQDKLQNNVVIKKVQSNHNFGFTIETSDGNFEISMLNGVKKNDMDECDSKVPMF